MPRVSGSAWKILSLIIRKTKGWHKVSDAIAYSQIREGTGIKGDPTVSAALKELLEMGCIEKRQGTSQFDPTSYRLNRKFSVQIEDKTEEADPWFETAPTKDSLVGNRHLKNFSKEKATTKKTLVAAAKEIKAVPTKESLDTKRKEETNKSNTVRTANLPKKSTLFPEPSEAADTRMLAHICKVNLVRPTALDVEYWADTVDTIETSMPDSTVEERVRAIEAFVPWCKKLLGRNALYLSNVMNNWHHFLDEYNNENNGAAEPQSASSRVTAALEATYAKNRVNAAN